MRAALNGSSEPLHLNQRPPDERDPEEDVGFDDPGDFTHSRGWRWAVYSISALILLSLLLPALLFACNSGSGGAPATGARAGADSPLAPDFRLPAAAGGDVRLYDVIDEHGTVVLVFYRGFF